METQPQGASIQSAKITREFGTGGGDPFPMEYPHSLGVRGQGYVDALILNEQRRGGTGGDNPQEYTLGSDDYWSEFEVHAGRYVDWVGFKAKSGRSVSGGGGGGDARFSAKGIRILRIGGAAGRYLDNIRIEYIENYQPSKVVTEGQAVLDFQPGGRTITTYTDTKTLTAQAYERITEHSTEFTFNTSAEGEYFSKFSASTGFKMTNSTREDVKSSSEQALNTGQKVQETLSPDEAAFLIGNINVMQDSDGHYWTYPTRAPNWVRLPSAKFRNLNNYFDFTSGVSTQTGFSHRKQYGLDVLTAS